MNDYGLVVLKKKIFWLKKISQNFLKIEGSTPILTHRVENPPKI